MLYLDDEKVVFKICHEQVFLIQDSYDDTKGTACCFDSQLLLPSLSLFEQILQIPSVRVHVP